MVGHDHSAITPAGLGGELPAALQCIREGGRVAHYVTQRLHKDGSSLDVSITVSPVRNRSGVVIGVSTVARDVTDDMRNQAELAHQSELFLSAAGELRVALARAEQSGTSYRVLLDQLPDMATFTYGSDYRVSAVSGSWFLPCLLYTSRCV